MKRISLIVSMAFLLLSCSKNEQTIIVDGTFDLSFRAELPEMQLIENPELQGIDSTKAVTQYTVRIKWTAGDKLSVVNLTTGKLLGGYLTSNASGTVTTFSGSLQGTVRDGDKLAYVYPATENASEKDFEGFHIDLSSQGGTTNDVPLAVYSTTTATSESFNNATITFSFLMCYMMVALTDLPASTKINSVTITNVTKSFGLAINSAHSGFDIVDVTQGDVVLTPSQNSTASGARTVYAGIPASASATRNVILETSTTTFSTTFTSAQLQNGYAYNTNVSGFLVDDLIPEEPSLRTYFLEHFDSNKDGKLSMVEIAGVKEFPDQDLYPLPSDITRFTELEYFYGLTELPSFEHFNKLGVITIPKQITSIPDDTFNGCTSLTKVILKPSVPPVLGEDVFSGVAGSLILVVDDEVVADYQAAEKWKDFFNNFRTESSQNDSSVKINTEDEDTMGEDRIDIIVK